MPLSELKAVRRAAAEQCVKALALHNKTDGLATASKLPELLPAVIHDATWEALQRRQDPQLRVLCRSMAQASSPRYCSLVVPPQRALCDSTPMGSAVQCRY